METNRRSFLKGLLAFLPACLLVPAAARPDYDARMRLANDAMAKALNPMLTVEPFKPFELSPITATEVLEGQERINQRTAQLLDRAYRHDVTRPRRDFDRLGRRDRSWVGYQADPLEPIENEYRAGRDEYGEAIERGWRRHRQPDEEDRQ